MKSAKPLKVHVKEYLRLMLTLPRLLRRTEIVFQQLIGTVFL